MNTRFKLFRISAVLLILIGMGAYPALATEGNLPGGTSISVDITSPPDGTLVAYPPGDVALSGTAAVGEGLALPNTAIVYVVDVSGSTAALVGCGGNPNGDADTNSILDCEIAAASSLNATAAGLGTVGDVGLAAFGESSAAADVQPAGGDESLTAPDADLNGAGGFDMDEALNSLNYGAVNMFTAKAVGSGSTNFAAGLSSAVGIAAASTKPNRMIIFMSDGQANTGADVGTVAVPADVTIFTFAVGAGSSCSADPQGLGSLDEISSMGSGAGYCTPVTDVASLPDILPSVIQSELTSLGLSVDGGAEIDISSSAAPALPQNGPISVDWNYDLPGLMPGIHNL